MSTPSQAMPVVFIPALLCDEELYRDVITALGDAVEPHVLMSPKPSLEESVVDLEVEVGLTLIRRTPRDCVFATPVEHGRCGRVPAQGYPTGLPVDKPTGLRSGPAAACPQVRSTRWVTRLRRPRSSGVARPARSRSKFTGDFWPRPL